MRAVAVALFAAIVLLSLDWQLLLMALPSRRPTREAMARRADPNPELARFLGGVRSRTMRGDTIVLVIPPLLQQQADAYRFRASYHLAGRNVLPAEPENLRRANYVAAWRVPVAGEVTWAGDGGVLVRQR